MSRLQEDIDAAARIGQRGAGVTRFAWSSELSAANDWLAERMRELELDVDVDAAGNVFGRWRAGSGKPVVVGSHLDTVPHGGRYDGALGVLAGLHAMRLLKAKGVEPHRPVWLASFMDEEGGRFGTTLFGSRAFAGHDLSDVAERGDRDGVTLQDAMQSCGFDFRRLPEACGIDDVGAYLELHIEQGPVLERAAVDIGVVTAIVGLLGFRVRLGGQANHAGTTPMELRRDALVGAARVAVALRDAARDGADIKATVGSMSVEPGGANVIPGGCEFTVDLRSPTPKGLVHAEALLRDVLSKVASEEGLDADVRETSRLPPAPLDAAMQDMLERAADVEGASHMRLASGAGHDAMMLAPHVPTAMLFVPSRMGLSHSPDEFTPPEQCDVGARVLARALELLVAAGQAP